MVGGEELVEFWLGRGVGRILVGGEVLGEFWLGRGVGKILVGGEVLGEFWWREDFGGGRILQWHILMYWSVLCTSYILHLLYGS